MKVVLWQAYGEISLYDLNSPTATDKFKSEFISCAKDGVDEEGDTILEQLRNAFSIQGAIRFYKDYLKGDWEMFERLEIVEVTR